MQEAKIVATVRVDEVVHHMENLSMELLEVEAEFNELKCNKVQLERLKAETHATVAQYDIVRHS